MHTLEQPVVQRLQTRSALIRIAGLVLLLLGSMAVAWKLGLFDYRDAVEHIARVQRSHGAGRFTLGFVAAYALAVALGAPGLPFTVAGGALFGTAPGATLSWVGAMIGAAAGYWIARTIGHDIVLRWLSRFRRVDAAVRQARDFAGMLRLRLLPVLPLGVVNFAGGLAKAPFGAYMVATGIGITPTTIVYCYFADSFIEGMSKRSSGAVTSLIGASVLLIGLSLVPRLVKSRSDASTTA